MFQPQISDGLGHAEQHAFCGVLLMSFGGQILRVLFRVEIVLAISAYVLIFGLLITDVVMRELGLGSIFGAQRISVYLMIICGFLGLGLAASQGRHLRPRFLDGVIPASLSATADRIGSVIMTAVFAVFGVIAVQFLLEAIEYGELARTIRIPMWSIQVIVPYAFFSTALRYAIFVIDPDLRPQEALE